jgi:hypothetical protein
MMVSKIDFPDICLNSHPIKGVKVAPTPNQIVGTPTIFFGTT